LNFLFKAQQNIFLKSATKKLAAPLNFCKVTTEKATPISQTE